MAGGDRNKRINRPMWNQRSSAPQGPLPRKDVLLTTQACVAGSPEISEIQNPTELLQFHYIMISSGLLGYVQGDIQYTLQGPLMPGSEFL